jgi:DNA-binding NarL/FixJ family response regulator
VVADSRVRIVVADGHPLYRRGLATLLAAQPGWAVVAQEDSGVGAAAAVLETHPDLVVLDLGVPHLDVVEATRRIVATDPAIGVLLVSRRDDSETAFAAIRAGAAGYLLKTANDAETLRAVATVAAGAAVVGPSVARRVIEFFAIRGAAELSGREREILDLVAAGWGDADIAKVLVLTTAAVRAHVTAVTGRLRAAGAGDPERPRILPVRGRD